MRHLAVDIRNATPCHTREMHLLATLDFVSFDFIYRASASHAKTNIAKQFGIQRTRRERKLRDGEPNEARETESEIGELLAPSRDTHRQSAQPVHANPKQTDCCACALMESVLDTTFLLGLVPVFRSSSGRRHASGRHTDVVAK